MATESIRICYIQDLIFTDENFAAILLFIPGLDFSQNKDPRATEIITSDLDNFWIALEKAGDAVDPKASMNFI